MEAKFYIQKAGFVGNSLLWWAKEDTGYTTNITQAKVFTKSEAEEICKDEYSDKQMHEQQAILNCSELHINCQSEKFVKHAKRMNLTSKYKS